MTDELPVEQSPAQAIETIKRSGSALVQMGDRGVRFANLEDLLRFASMAVRGGAAPKGMSESAAALAIQAGLERGLGPLGGLQAAVVVNGVLSWRGTAAAALIQNSGACKPGTLRFGCAGEGEEMVGWAEAWRVGYSAPERREFTVADAKRANLWKKPGPWQEYPKRQMQWRALGFLARDVFPDVLGGFALAEEAQDFHEPEPARRPTVTVVQPLPTSDPLLETLRAEREGGE